MTIQRVIRINSQVHTIRANHSQAIIHLDNGDTLYPSKGRLSWLGNVVYKGDKGRFQSIPVYIGK